MTALMNVQVMATAYSESATATRVTMATTAAKATPSLFSRVMTLIVKMVLSATILPMTVDLSVHALQATLVHFVNEKSLMIRALGRLAVAMASVPPQREGKPLSVTATRAGGASPVIKQSISVKKQASRVEATASVWPIRRPANVILTLPGSNASFPSIFVVLTIRVKMEAHARVISIIKRSRVNAQTTTRGNYVRAPTKTLVSCNLAKMEPTALD